MKSFIALLIVCLFGCAPKDHHPISEALGRSFIDGKISSKKVSEILDEYIPLAAKNEELADKYVIMLEVQVSLNHDSTEIDAARKKFLEQHLAIE